MRALLFAEAAALAALALAGAATPASSASACPAARRAGWQALADRIHAPVYCPTWMPAPLDGNVHGQYKNGLSVKKDRSYWVSFLSADTDSEVHVNFRGYPGRASVPKCLVVEPEGKRTIRGTKPCFASSRGTVTSGAIHATLYTVNQDADQWHLLYAWRHGGSLYVVSEHFGLAPYSTTAQVERNLLRIMRGLVLVQPHKS
jgi:hypothetical protein